MSEIFTPKSVYKSNNSIQDSESIRHISKELMEGFKVFQINEKYVSVFGSARVHESEPTYKLSEEIGGALAKGGYSVITGGGPGVMEAAAKGASQNGGCTYGINVILPHEQDMNPYIKVPYRCRYLFTRKILLMKNSCGFIIMPGGFGTLDELFEIVTLVAIKVSSPIPVILVGSAFWGGLREWIEKELITQKFISKSEFNIITICDSVDEIIEILDNSVCPPKTIF